MQRASRNSNRKFAVESLESRRLMTGNVSVSVVNGDLRITGDSLPNEVAVFQTITQGVPVAGSYFVNGINGTTINGGAGRTFTGVNRDFFVDLSSGDDRLTIGNDLANNTCKVPRDLTVNLGEGANRLDIKGITVADDALITSGAGRDQLFLRGTFGAPNIDNGFNDLTIRTGSGADKVEIRNSFVRHDLLVDTGSDISDDVVNLFVGNVGNNTTINTGAGRDVVAIDQMSFNFDLNVNTGSDADKVFISGGTDADRFFVDLGSGADELHLTDVFGRRGTFNGGSDVDALFQSGQVAFTEQVQFQSF